MLRINRKEQSAWAHYSWYVFILGGTAIHLTVCVCVYVCVCEPEVNSTCLCIHYLPWCRHYGVIAHGAGVSVYHRECFSWSKITVETKHVVPVSVRPDKLSLMLLFFCCVTSTRGKLFACHRISGAQKRIHLELTSLKLPLFSIRFSGLISRR